MPDWVDDVDWGTVGLIAVGLATALIYWQLLRLGKRQEQGNQEHRDAIQKIQRDQAEALKRLADSWTSEQSRASSAEAMLSMTMRQTGQHSYKLVIRNRGPGSARVISVESLSDPNMLVGPLGLDDLTLHAGEEHTILAAPSLATPGHPKILVSWLDSRGLQTREQAVSL
jgi:hypothetical protein